MHVHNAAEHVLDAHAVGKSRVHGLQLGALAGQDARITLRATLDEHGQHVPDLAPVLGKRAFLSELLEPLEALDQDLAWRVVGHRGGRRSGTFRVDEAKHLAVAHLSDDIERFLEVLFGLSGKSDDDVR